MTAPPDFVCLLVWLWVSPVYSQYRTSPHSTCPACMNMGTGESRALASDLATPSHSWPPPCVCHALHCLDVVVVATLSACLSPPPPPCFSSLCGAPRRLPATTHTQLLGSGMSSHTDPATLLHCRLPHPLMLSLSMLSPSACSLSLSAVVVPTRFNLHSIIATALHRYGPVIYILSALSLCSALFIPPFDHCLWEPSSEGVLGQESFCLRTPCSMPIM